MNLTRLEAFRLIQSLLQPILSQLISYLIFFGGTSEIPTSFQSTLNRPCKVGQQGRFALRENAGIFYSLQIIFLANSEFIFAIRDPKLRREGQEHTLVMAQSKGAIFYFYPKNSRIDLVGPTLYGRFSVLPSFHSQ